MPADYFSQDLGGSFRITTFNPQLSRGAGTSEFSSLSLDQLTGSREPSSCLHTCSWPVPGLRRGDASPISDVHSTVVGALPITTSPPQTPTNGSRGGMLSTTVNITSNRLSRGSRVSQYMFPDHRDASREAEGVSSDLPSSEAAPINHTPVRDPTATHAALTASHEGLLLAQVAIAVQIVRNEHGEETSGVIPLEGQVLFLRIQEAPRIHDVDDGVVMLPVVDSTSEHTVMIRGALEAIPHLSLGPPGDPASEQSCLDCALERYVPGSLVAVMDPDLVIEPSFNVIFVDLSSKSSLRFLGRSEFPEFTASQLCNLAEKLPMLEGDEGADVRLSMLLDAGEKLSGEDVANLVPNTLDNLALAQLHLGREGIALAYAVASTRIRYRRSTARSVLYVASILHRRGLLLGATITTDSKQMPAEIDVVDDMIRAAAAALPSPPTTRLEKVRDAAQTLADAQEERISFVLAAEAPLVTAAGAAVALHGAGAAAVLKAEGDALFRRECLEGAVVKWRTALKVACSDGPAQVTSETWPSVLSIRGPLFAHIPAYGTEQGVYEHMLDLTSLMMLQGTQTKVPEIAAMLRVLKCKMGLGRPEILAAIEAALQISDIE